MTAPSVRALSSFVLPLGLLTGLLAGPAQAQTQKLDVPYVPTPQPVVAHMLEMADVGPDDYVIDLGSGDGRIAIAAVKDRGAKAAYGIDLNPERVREATQNAEAAGVADKVTFEQGDLFKKDIADADVLTMYLLSTVNMRLRPVILDTLKPGTRVVSHAFNMEDWEPDATAVVGGSLVYLWVVPAKVTGKWTIEADGQTYQVELSQNFQQVTGSVDGQPERLSGRLEGSELYFTLNDQLYVGRVEGDRIQAVSAEGAVSAWIARRG
ncbi:50S ribosomal protein L11 methyltransferase [Pseudomonas sp. GD03944]|uniref:50S ribosomal protein L11 methyltransferase n=1 Tax=Pseudomonas sp. GD03944 TaxID=2975409 RepID=UPI0024479F80|nr:50S ribosomal protein L11 methyltransferase [Pseudomonas sp. GD03944]MDH1265140.1 methyltransferase domain-containing protein [Pseudomonas sp. GD03944]